MRIAFRFFPWSMSLMMRGRNRGDVGAHTATCSTVPLPALDITAASVVVPALPKYVFFLILTGNKFHAPKHGMGWMLLPSPFSCFRLRRGFTEASNLGGAAVQSNPHCGFLSVVPKTFYALLHHRVAADFLPLTPPPTEECLLWGGRVHISFSCHANSLIL